MVVGAGGTSGLASHAPVLVISPAMLTEQTTSAKGSTLASKANVQSIRGMGDVLPVGQKQLIYQSEKWVWLRRAYDEWTMAHGYRYIETPIVEEIDLFKRTSGETSDIVNKEMYLVRRSSQDGDEEKGFHLCLRPEGSAGVSRAVVEHGLARSASGLKFYYMAPMFRSERPQKGRYRQHTQIGAEVFKEESPAADVEVIALLYNFYRRIGLEQLELNINSVGDPNCRPAYREALIKFLEQFKDKMSEDSRARMYSNPMRCLDSKDRKDQELFADAPMMLEYLNEECSEHFAEVKMGLEKLGIPFTVNPRLVRGLDYYTKTAFEVLCKSLDGAIQTIGGGGRYDGLVELLGGPPTPAVGFGSGIERVLLALDSQNIEIPGYPAPRALIAYLDNGVKYDALKMAEELRSQGHAIEFVYRAKNLGKQLSHANKLGANFAVIVGGVEWERGEVSLKNLITRDERAVKIEDVSKILATAAGANSPML